MFEDIFVRSPWLLIPLLALLGSTLIVVIWVGGAYWRSVQKLDIEARLKQDMLNRGFSPANIERVLRASSGAAAALAARPEPPITNEFALAKKLLDDGYPLEDIDRLVRTLKQDPGAEACAPGRAVLG